MREPGIGGTGSKQVVRKDGVDAAGDSRRTRVIDCESGENPVGVRLPASTDIAVEHHVCVPQRKHRRVGRWRVCNPHLMEIIDLSDVAARGCICYVVGGYPMY